MHLIEVAASVQNGVYEAGGIPLDLTVVSHRDAVAEYCGDCHRGDAPSQPDRCRRAAWVT
jgi:hypothetical protein